MSYMSPHKNKAFLKYSSLSLNQENKQQKNAREGKTVYTFH